MGTQLTVSRTIVVDASAGVAVAQDEPTAHDIRRLLRAAALSAGRIVVPSGFWVEVVSVLARRYRYTVEEIVEAVATLDGLGLTTVDAGRSGLLSVIDATVEHRLTAYDATYLALAEALDAELLTLDRDLAAAAGDRAVSAGDQGVSEPRPRYRLQPWIPWPGTADYLDAVRRVTVAEAESRSV